MKPRQVIGYTVGILGILGVVTCASVTLWWIFARPSADHDGLYFPTLLFVAVGWWGFFWAEPKRAVQGGDWLVNVQQRVAGRRKTDPVVAVPEPVPAAASASDGVGAPSAPAQPAAPASPLDQDKP
jgi:hypothetical protein